MVNPSSLCSFKTWIPIKAFRSFLWNLFTPWTPKTQSRAFDNGIVIKQKVYIKQVIKGAIAAAILICLAPVQIACWDKI